ncbi:MAG TPA: RNA chaperone Hfq [Thermotogota bacterium]|nr:RNA chaperone Hfq [Thermotogota bacterium]HRW92381.1 RNA chaperone Hfq [Thermotogota bacterium]
MAEKFSLQDPFINHLRTHREKVRVFLVNGFQLQGKIRSFDNFTILLEDGKSQNLIFKHAISTIEPAGVVRLTPPDSNSSSR